MCVWCVRACDVYVYLLVWISSYSKEFSLECRNILNANAKVCVFSCGSQESSRMRDLPFHLSNFVTWKTILMTLSIYY